ncbi:MAG TPA: FliH/SctL family protein [Acidimicrobiia bacterium]|nr:FliH/SctL family protein [Acidimicrobiia bacterium]
MNWSSENLMRGRVLRDWDIDLHATPITRADLGTVSARSARGIVVSPELVESARVEGYTAGFEEGYNAGYAHGIDDARRHVELLGQLVQQLGREADAFAARETTARAEIEDQVVAVAMEIAEVLVGHTLAEPDGRGRDAIARALALAPVHGDVVARLHPADIAVLGDPETLVPGRVLAIVPDPSLSPGDCVVDVASCRVDARISAAIERVREVLS